jgi:rSAM/selenodomain-associated transferase 2
MGNNKKTSKKLRISIIIPVLYEANRINLTIDHVYNQEFYENYEIIVVDGDPYGETANTIERKEVKTVLSPKGRALQMNAGAAAARGEILLFLHADTRLPDGALQKISSAMGQGKYMAGAFDLGIDSDKPALRAIARAASLRSRFTRIPYGDQAIFVLRDYFNKIGCYKNIPLMEDVELMQRIKNAGDKIYIISDRVSTSPRRWEREGIIYCSLRNIIIANLYFIGVSPDKLVRYYRRRHRNVQKNH